MRICKFEAKFFKLSLILSRVIDSVLQREEKALIIAYFSITKKLGEAYGKGTALKQRPGCNPKATSCA
jgi:hypothetical protein